MVLPLWIVVFKAYGLYDRDLKRISHQTIDDLPWIFHAVIVGCLLLLACYRFLPVGGIWLGALAVFALLAIVWVTVLRAVARRLAVSVLGPERVVLLGDGTRDLHAGAEAGGERPPGCEVGRPDPTLVLERGFQWRTRGGDAGDLRPGRGGGSAPTRNGSWSRARTSTGAELFELLNRARELGVKVSVLPQLFEALGPSVEIDDVEGITVLGINPPVLPRSSRFLKAGMDITGAVILLILTAPLFAVIAIAIKLDSPGPVFFHQERIGLWGRRFRLVKFRTMTVDAEQLKGTLAGREQGPGLAPSRRRPAGDASRPRPPPVEPRRAAAALERAQGRDEPGGAAADRSRPRTASSMAGAAAGSISTPGLTGLWQVMGRTSIPFEEMIRLDYVYVTNWSLWTDIRLVLRTLPAVLRTERGELDAMRIWIDLSNSPHPLLFAPVARRLEDLGHRGARDRARQRPDGRPGRERWDDVEVIGGPSPHGRAIEGAAPRWTGFGGSPPGRGRSARMSLSPTTPTPRSSPPAPWASGR